MSASLLRVMSTKTEPRLLHQVDTTTPHQKITYRQLSDKPTKDGPKVTSLLKNNVIFQCQCPKSQGSKNPKGPKNPRVEKPKGPNNPRVQNPTVQKPKG